MLHHERSRAEPIFVRGGLIVFATGHAQVHVRPAECHAALSRFACHRSAASCYSLVFEHARRVSQDNTSSIELHPDLCNLIGKSVQNISEMLLVVFFA
mmetsp:Transcript_122288/g.228450  ORF Transcript_122288/g.228450 Transcript_122288/m.228450 type:complete len:98 (+) Transcript_122288:1675-1968(+)